MFGCGGASQELLICPNIELVYDEINDVLQAPEGFTEYVWYYNGLALDDEIGFEVSAPFNGNYSVEVTDENGCEVESPVFTVDFGNSVAEINGQNWKVYPNPTSDFLSLSGNVSGLDSYQVIDLSGRVWVSEKWDSQQNRIDVRPLPSGMYILQIQGLKQNTSAIRFVVSAR